MEYRAIIVAGGRGTRMGAQTPKQYMLINGKPCFQHAIESFLSCGLDVKITMVIAKDALPHIADAGRAFLREHNVQLVEGGAERYNSVMNALNALDDFKGIVAVHDAARPLVSSNVIRECFLHTRGGIGAVAASSTPDTVRYRRSEREEILYRGNVFLVHTPQCFVASELRKSYKTLTDYDGITDDAGVYEKSGHRVILVPDSRYNIKITTLEDLEVVERLIKKPLEF